jgi:hypothetical protein
LAIVEISAVHVPLETVADPGAMTTHFQMEFSQSQPQKQTTNSTLQLQLMMLFLTQSQQLQLDHILQETTE